MADANIWVAIWAGMLSFLSPCVLPLVPSYLGYMSGASVQKGTVQAPRLVILFHALIFVLGFTLIFVMIFGLGAELLRNLFGYNWRTVIQWVGGIMMIIFGLHFLGIFNLPWLDMTKRLDVRPDPRLGYLRSFIIGVGFAIGWTPCIGPFLGLLLSMTGQAQAIPLFIAYSLGLGVPFIIAALSMGQLTVWLRKITRRTFDLKIGGRVLLHDLNVISMVSGVLLIFMGILLISNRVTWLNQIIAPLLPEWLQSV
jgi:cytochrome c-type biogenesis protein